MTRPKRIATIDLEAAAPPQERGCAAPGCAEDGTYRAPKSREPRDGYHWFCLAHVREYNAGWDFFAGMNAAQIEDYLKRDCTWHRPTWRLGVRPGATLETAWVRDDLGLLGEIGIGVAASAQAAASRLPPEERRALATLDLEPRVSLHQIKSRYKELVKRYHPDANGGDKRAEERLKVINQAYDYLLTCGYS